MNGWRDFVKPANAKTNNGRQHDRLSAQQFEEALDDDLNISAALGFLFESIRETNRAMDQNETGRRDGKSVAGLVEARSTAVLDLEQGDRSRGPSRKWRSWQKSARTRDTKRIGKEATNCAIKFPR